MALQFKKAVREAVKLKALITGPSGSGKTLGGISLARDLNLGKIAVLDSENDRASYYADQLDFDVLSLPDAKPKTYLEGLKAAQEAGYGIVVIDSLSHAWQNVLDAKDAYEKANPNKGNSYTNWRTFGSEWETFIRRVLDAPIHVIATSRSKQDYEQGTDSNGKKIVTKLGLAPMIREGTDYEFALHLDLNVRHKATVMKDNTFLFGDEQAIWDLTDGSVAKPLAAWLGTAKPAAPKPVSDKQRKTFAAILERPVWSTEERDTFSVAEAKITTMVEYQQMLDDLIETGKAKVATDPGASA